MSGTLESDDEDINVVAVIKKVEEQIMLDRLAALFKPNKSSPT